MAKEKVPMQGSFSFDGKPEHDSPSPSKGKGVKIDCDKIRGELEDLAGPIVKVELNELQEAACRIQETDVGKFHFIVSLNPKRIRDRQMLNEVLKSCREAMLS